jgi:hypothetical protein
MKSSLLPERSLQISPTLATTIGLEEAVMLQVLAELISHRESCSRPANPKLHWVELSDKDLQEHFPFWATVDIKRVQNSLQNLGLVVIDRDSGHGVVESSSCFYAIDEPGGKEHEGTTAKQQAAFSQQAAASQTTGSTVASTTSSAASRNSRASLIPPNWQPGENWIGLCKQHNIPEQFALDQVQEFVMYWRDRAVAKPSWGNTFYKRVLQKWREEQTRKGAFELATEMSAQWRPSGDAIGMLEMAGINSSFIEDAIPEFVLYWRERGIVDGAWNTKFIAHVRRQWAKFSASFGYDDTPKAMSSDWQPSADCFDILHLAEIDEKYARSKIPEFVMYWKDSQQVKTSWNTVFLQYIKQDWARQLKQAESADLPYAEDQSLVGSSQQKVKEKFQRISDRSWAE